MKFKFSLEDRVSIGFNAISDEEAERLAKAVSGGDKSRVVSGNHQTEAETGIIIEQRNNAEGVFYLVKIDVSGVPKGRLRNISEETLTLI